MGIQKKLKIFKHDIQNLIHFPSLLEQCKGKKGYRYVQFIVRFSDFFLWENICCCLLKTLF